MPLSVDSIIQTNTGSFNSTSGSATLPVGTTAGSLVLICATVADKGFAGGGPWTLVMPAGFTYLSGGVPDDSRNKPYIWAKRNTSAESSWTIDVEPTAQQVVWAVFEIEGVGLDPLDVTGYHSWYATTLNATGAMTLVTTRSTGTTDQASCYDTLAIAVHAATSADTTVPAITGHTNGFTQIASEDSVDATQAIAMSVSYKPSLTLDAFEATATISPSSYTYGVIIALYADGASHAPMIDVMTGFEFGTVTSITNGSELYGTTNNTAPFDGVVGSPEIVTAHPRTGTYGLKLSSSAAAECLTWTSPGVLFNNEPRGTPYPIVMRLHVYFETSLPGADVELASIEAGSLANGVVVWYRTASQKIGVKVGTGTEQVSDAVVAVDKHIGIDLRYDPRTTTHLCDWQVDYDSLDTTAAPVAQTQASMTGMTVAEPSTIRLGWSVSRTATVFCDDVVVTKQWGSYPLGDYRIRPINVDPAGTPSIVGTSGNFRVFTSNGGTLSTWTAAGARDSLDEVPPTIGASSDGVTQVAVASADWCEVPMETFACAPLYVPRALRWYVAGWGASGNPGTLALTFGDTTTPPAAEGMEIIIGDHGFDTAALRWLCRMHRNFRNNFTQLTQAKLDALRARVGGSTDANPDVGIHNVFAELAYQPADVIQIMSGEEDAFKVFVRQDPVSSAVASYLLDTTAANRGATLTWTINAVDGSQHIDDGTTYEKVIGADDVAGVTAVGMIVDPAA